MLSYKLRAVVEERSGLAERRALDACEKFVLKDTDTYNSWEVRYEIIDSVRRRNPMATVRARLKYGPLAQWLELPDLPNVFS